MTAKFYGSWSPTKNLKASHRFLIISCPLYLDFFHLQFILFKTTFIFGVFSLVVPVFSVDALHLWLGVTLCVGDLGTSCLSVPLWMHCYVLNALYAACRDVSGASLCLALVFWMLTRFSPGCGLPGLCWDFVFGCPCTLMFPSHRSMGIAWRHRGMEAWGTGVR